jgi:beta-xylosidase
VDEVATGGGVWAPTIRHRDGVFFVIVTIAMTPRGCVVFTATDPAGQWSDGVTIDGVGGIDPDLAWDEDGRAYVTFSGLHTSGEQVGQHLGIQHADLVATPDGGTALVLLGVRPLGLTQSFSPLGRETFITPVSWAGGWPQTEPVLLAPRDAVDEEVFDFADPNVLEDLGWLAPGRRHLMVRSWDLHGSALS